MIEMQTDDRQLSESLDESQSEMLEQAVDTFEALGRYIESLYQQYSTTQAFEDAKKLAKESRKYYNVEAEPTNFPWPNASNIITPLTRIAVDELEPRMVSSIIGQTPIITVSSLPNPIFGLAEDQMRMFGKQVEELIDYLIKDEVEIEKWMPLLIHNLLLDGNAYVLLSWTEEYRTMQTLEGRTEDKLIFRGVRAEIQPFEHVFTADDVNDEEWEDQPVLVYRGQYTLAQLQRMAMSQTGWVVTPEELAEEVMEASSDISTADEDVKNIQHDLDVLPEYLKPVECILAFVKWRLDDTVPIEDDLVVLVSKKSWKVLRILRQVDVIGTNIKPIRRVRLFPQQGVSFSEPLYSASKGLQICIDALWNRCVNSADITITPWFIYPMGLAYEGINDLAISPGKGVGLPSTEGIVFPNLSQFNPVQFIPLITEVIGFWERTFNVSDYNQGRESAIAGRKGSTATGTLAVLQEGKIKHDYQGMLLRMQLERIISVIFDMYKMNLTVEDTAKILGDPIPPEMLNQPYTLSLHLGDSTVNKFVRRQELESFITSAQPMWDMFNPIFFAELFSREYQFDPKETIDPELNRVVQQYRFVKAEAAKLAAATRMTDEEARNMVAETGQTADSLIQMMQMRGQAVEEKPE